MSQLAPPICKTPLAVAMSSATNMIFVLEVASFKDMTIYTM
jgi:hypothetical protein